MTAPKPPKALRVFDENEIREVIFEWKCFWSNQTQNSKEDFENYARRAFGVDANMQHNLAKRIFEAFDQDTEEIQKLKSEVERLFTENDNLKSQLEFRAMRLKKRLGPNLAEQIAPYAEDGDQLEKELQEAKNGGK